MRERKEVIEFCLGFNGTYEDYPFHDFNWTVMGIRTTRKCLQPFMSIMEIYG